MVGIIRDHIYASNKYIFITMVRIPYRQSLCDIFLVIDAYARLRYHAASQPLAHWDYLHSMGPISAAASDISHRRAYDLASALLLMDFHVGDLIRWLGGDYTHDHIPIEPIEEAVAAISNVPPQSGYPIINFDQALHVLRHGAPPLRSSRLSSR